MYLEEIHPTKSDPPNQVNHVRQEFRGPRTRQCQPPSQRRGKRWNECRVGHWFVQTINPVVDECEVFQVLKHSNEVDYLPTVPFGLSR